MKPAVPRMNDAQARAWMALVSTAELLPHALDAQLTQDAGLINYEYGILSILNVAQNHTMRMNELATALDSPAPRLSKAVSRLERRQLVERAATVGDGRAVSVHLTREGRKTWLRVTPAHVALARDTLLADYSEADLIRLAALLERLVHRLDPNAALGRT